MLKVPAEICQAAQYPNSHEKNISQESVFSWKNSISSRYTQYNSCSPKQSLCNSLTYEKQMALNHTDIVQGVADCVFSVFMTAKTESLQFY